MTIELAILIVLAFVAISGASIIFFKLGKLDPKEKS